VDGRVDIAWFAAGTGRIRIRETRRRYCSPSALDVHGRSWDLERPETDVAAELTDEIITSGSRGVTESVEFVVGEPDIVLVHPECWLHVETVQGAIEIGRRVNENASLEEFT
jgi:hypothetical protein